jgi:hypothetical protein
MGGHFASMHMYINIIICAIDNSYDAWERVLTALDTELTITVRTQLAPAASAIDTKDYIDHGLI